MSDDPSLVYERLDAIRKHLTTAASRWAFEGALADPNFHKAPGSSDKHHGWTGGLILHSVQVIEIALKMAEVVPVNKDVLVVAGIWHDYGKIWSYTPDPSFPGSAHEPMKWIDSPLKSKLGGHLARSYAEFIRYATGQVSNPFLEEVAHCILAHHGCREWGSPARPQTNEAWLLHTADQVSARCLGGEKKDPHK